MRANRKQSQHHNKREYSLQIEFPQQKKKKINGNRMELNNKNIYSIKI